MAESTTPLYQRIYDLVRQVPPGQVASYGQIAGLVGTTARVVGFALASLPAGSDVPWQRIINSRGEISPRRDGGGNLLQRVLLETEGISFDSRGRIDLKRFGWRVSFCAPCAARDAPRP